MKVTYGSGEVKHNPTYYYNVQDHLHVKQYIDQFTRDIENKNYKSHWFYMNAAAMPVWVALEPPLPEQKSSDLQNYLNELKSDAYEIPWFFIETIFLPVFMALEPPFNQRTSAYESADPNFRGSLPNEGPIVPAPMPGKLQWHYEFLNPDGTVKPVDTRPDP